MYHIIPSVCRESTYVPGVWCMVHVRCNSYFIWNPPHHRPPPTAFHWRTEHVVIVAILVFVATLVITSSYHLRRQRNRRFQECDMYERKDFLTRA